MMKKEIKDPKAAAKEAAESLDESAGQTSNTRFR
jgi:hypothetical protein